MQASAACVALLLLGNAIVIAIALFGNSHLSDWLFTRHVSTQSIARLLEDLTREPHLAGTPAGLATARYVQDKLSEFGLPTRTADYEVLLSYPVHRSLSVISPYGEPRELSLDEEPVEGDSYTHNTRVVPTFLAYSPSGKALAEVVYANYGQKSDFDVLKSMGVDVRGSIVIARLGKSFRGDIVFNAQNEGAVAVVLYPDPEDYARNGTQGYYPSSKWLPPSGVQRGSLLQDPGDPLTPGWASTKFSERVDASQTSALGIPQIPALPISSRNALEVISALRGPVAPAAWQGGLAVDRYRTGKGPIRLDLRYVSNQTIATIRNVFGVIEGVEKDRYVLLGNHRDAWTFGASDPNSGTACLLEIARIFGKLFGTLSRKPARTIVFCSWDAEEYSLTGSTEWVEENLSVLSARAVAYLNVDEAVAGTKFSVSATPQLDNLLLEITKMVKDPDSKGTLFDSWCGDSKDCIGRLGGGGSDYASFLQHAGIPSIDLTYKDGDPIYHSLYDNFNWMKKFGDPSFKRHATVVKVWGLVAKRLAMDKILPFNYVAYANELEAAVKELEKTLLLSLDGLETFSNIFVPPDVTFAPLYSAVKQLREFAPSLMLSQHSTRTINDMLILGERCFLDPQGLPGKPWFRHLIYGPSQNNVYGSTTFPAIVDSIAKLSLEKDKGVLFLRTQKQHLQHEIWRASRAIVNAASVMKSTL